MFNGLSPIYKGILFAFIGYTAFAWTDALVKYLIQQGYGIFQIVTIEGAIGVLALCLISRWIGGFAGTFERRYLKIHILRMVLNFLITVLFTYSLAHIPLTTVYALVFTKPFMASLLAIWMYKQKLQKHHVIAIFTGFIGTLIVLQPGSTNFEPVLLVPLGVTLIISILFLVSNSLKETSIFSLGFYPMLGSFLLTLPFAVGNFIMPDMGHIWIFMLVGLCAVTGIVFVSLAFRTASAAIVSPYTYSQIIWGIAFSIFIFNEIPNFTTLSGAGVIIFSGLYLIMKERRLSCKQ